MSKFGPGDQIIGKGRVQLTVVAATDRQYWLQDTHGNCLTYEIATIDCSWEKTEPRFEVGSVYAPVNAGDAWAGTDHHVVAVFNEGRAAITWYFDGDRVERPRRIIDPVRWRRVR